MRLCVFFFALLLSFTGIAQTTDVSAPMRMSGKLNKVRIIGKNQDGYVVRFSGGEELIHIYDNDLKLSIARTLDFKSGDGDLQDILLNKSGASLFYLHADKKQTMLMMQPVNSKFIEMSRAMVIDTFNDHRDLVDANLHFKSSIEQNYTLFYYPVFADERINSMQMTCIDRAGNVIYKTYLPIGRPEKDMEYAKSLVDNDGNGYLIFTAEKDAKDNSYGDEYFVMRIDRAKGQLTAFTVKCEKELFGEPQFDIDNVNHNLVFCGFYDEKGDAADPAANGFFYLQYDAVTGVLKHSAYNIFSTAFMTSLTGRDAGSKYNRLFTFNIRKMLLRIDGGAMFVAESVIKDKKEVLVSTPSPSFRGYMYNNNYNSYRTVNTFSYNDIIAFSIKADGSLDWNAIMRKKQPSEDDNGFNSSFAFINEKDRVHMIYLDEISSSGSADEYKLSSAGVVDRALLFSQDDKDIFLIPKLAKQVGPNEVVIPSVKSGVFRLVRVQY
jgi:hypothetical protein